MNAFAVVIGYGMIVGWSLIALYFGLAWIIKRNSKPAPAPGTRALIAHLAQSGDVGRELAGGLRETGKALRSLAAQSERMHQSTVPGETDREVIANLIGERT